MKKPVIIMIANQKGGVGKTSMTMELCYLFGKDYKVLGIDMDSQRNFTMYSGVEESGKTLKNVLDAECLLTDAIVKLEKYDVVAGDKALANASKLYGDADDIYLLQDILEDATDYDFVFLDSAPARSPLLYMEYIASDYVIAPTLCDDGSIEGLYELAEDIKRFSKRGQSHVKLLGTVMNINEKTAMHSISYETLCDEADAIGAKPFKTKIRKSIRVSEAKVARQCINEYEPYNNVSLDYKALKEEILERLNDGN